HPDGIRIFHRLRLKNAVFHFFIYHKHNVRKLFSYCKFKSETFGPQRLKSAPETAACLRILRGKTDSSERGAGHQRLYVFMSKCRSVAPGKERRRKNKRLKVT